MRQRIKIERPYEGLEFNYKKTAVRGYCSNNFNNSGLVTYRDDSREAGAEFFRGNNFKIYDTQNNYQMAFAEMFGDGKTTFVKVNEVTRHESGRMAIAYIDNGEFKIRVLKDFTKNGRSLEEI